MFTLFCQSSTSGFASEINFPNLIPFTCFKEYLVLSMMRKISLGQRCRIIGHLECRKHFTEVVRRFQKKFTEIVRQYRCSPKTVRFLKKKQILSNRRCY